MTGARGPQTRRPKAKRLGEGRSRFAVAALRRALFHWFTRHARPLPWRETPSPYSVWVSEVMLQQTQISTVIPYFQRFMKCFPSVKKLADAPLERVLELWSGLGYYRRARLMHRAAQEIVARFGGAFPSDYELARSLPGVGDYTARAVLSIAYQKPLFVLDGNVARVIARLQTMKGNVQQKPFRKSVEGILQQLISRRRAGDFNQALMQLGQLVCLPRVPRCEICPFRKKCKAYIFGAPQDFPEPRPRRSAESHFLAAGVLKHGKKVALVRGLDEGLLGDLWNFPSTFGGTRKAAKNLLDTCVARTFPSAILPVKPDVVLTHNITHRKIQVEVYVGQVAWNSSTDHYTAESQSLVATDNQTHHPTRWISLHDLSAAAVSRLARKIADTLS